MNTRNIMTRAWEIARSAFIKFGGRVREYISIALRMAWAEAKAEAAKTEYDVAAIMAAGKEWKSDDGRHHRVYFDAEARMNAIGAVVSFYKTGNISSASLNGKKISNTKARKMEDGSLFYDVNRDAWNGNTSREMFALIEARFANDED